MSNRIIVKGADFSLNGMPDVGVDLEPILGINVNNCTKASTSASNFYFPAPSFVIPKVKGRTIYAVRARLASGTSFSLVKLEGYTSDPQVDTANTGTITIIQTFTGATAGVVKDYFLDEPLVIPNTGDVTIGIRPTGGSTMGFLSATTPYLYGVSSLDNANWWRTTSYGGGFELLAEVI